MLRLPIRLNPYNNGELQEDVYIWAPEGTGFETGSVFKLDKSLYGLKQTPRVFNTGLTLTLNQHVRNRNATNIKIGTNTIRQGCDDCPTESSEID